MLRDLASAVMEMYAAVKMVHQFDAFQIRELESGRTPFDAASVQAEEQWGQYATNATNATNLADRLDAYDPTDDI